MYFTGLRFGSIFVRPVPLFTSTIWSRSSAALSYSRLAAALLHLLFQFAQEFGEIEIAAGFLDDRGLDLAAAQDGVQAFLHRALHGLRA